MIYMSQLVKITFNFANNNLIINILWFNYADVSYVYLYLKMQ